MDVSSKVDWLSVTYDSSVKMHELIPYRHELFVTKSPIPVYPHAFEASPHGAKVLIGSEAKYGKHLILSGLTLKSMYENGISEQNIYNSIRANGGRVSRVDICLDVVDVDGFSVDCCNDRLYDIDTELVGDKYIGRSEGKETLYLGNIKSKSRRFRIYDKGFEQNIPELNWVRIEYEKRRNADKLCTDIFENKKSISSVLKSVVNFPNWKLFQQIINADKASISRGEAQNKTSNFAERLNWLVESAAPALANCMLIEAKQNIYDENFKLENGVVLNTFISALNAQITSKFKPHKSKEN